MGSVSTSLLPAAPPHSKLGTVISWMECLWSLKAYYFVPQSTNELTNPRSMSGFSQGGGFALNRKFRYHRTNLSPFHTSLHSGIEIFETKWCTKAYRGKIKIFIPYLYPLCPLSFLFIYCDLFQPIRQEICA